MMVDARSRPDSERLVSVELFHAYGVWSSELERKAEDAERRGEDPIEVIHAGVRRIADRGAAVASRWASPYLDRLGLRASTCVLLDDYFRETGRHVDNLKWQAVGEIFRSALADKGITLDYVISERGLALTADELLSKLVPTPEQGAGSVRGVLGPGEVLDGSLWLNNLASSRPLSAPARGARGTPTTPTPTVERPPAKLFDAAFNLSRQHALRLDVQVHRPGTPGDRSSMPFSCPLLAAWWQLLRLGVKGEIAGDLEFANVIQTLSDRERPFRGRSTLSLLPTGVMEVESAVRLIIQHIADPPKAWQGAVFTNGESFHESVLRRMGYIFVDEQSTVDL